MRHLTALAICILAGCSPVAMPVQSAADPAQVAQSLADPGAVLLRMAETIGKAQNFSFTIQAGYDVVQDSGQKVEFGESRRIILNRPGSLRIDTTHNSGLVEQLLFNGKELVLYNDEENVFSRLPKPGSIDDLVRYVVTDLQARLPLSILLMSSVRQELEARVSGVARVDLGTISGVPTDHLAARGTDIDFQVWIARRGEPVPLRVVITYKTAPGQPQYWANLSDWNLAPKIDPAAFSFTPPIGAEAIPFMVPVTGKTETTRVRR